MIELNSHRPSSQAATELEDLQKRADSRRDRFRKHSNPLKNFQAHLTTLSASPRLWLKQLPSRYLIHTIVALTVPSALALGQVATRPVVERPIEVQTNAEIPFSLGPIMINDHDHSMPLVGDPPLAEDAALPIPISLSSRSEVLAPLIVPATISGDSVRLRNGPGLDYDEVGRSAGGTQIEVLGRHGEWLQIREAPGADIHWVAGELVDLPETILLALNPVASSLIPPPPPPKVGVVRESNLNLRDGPGTNYVAMTRLDAGATLTLEQQYTDWLYASSGSVGGWVRSDFLEIGPNVLNRVPVAATIPDPNPALVGTINENNVNLRRGPGSAYDRLRSANVGTEFALTARHKEWYQVRLSDGNRAWVYSELLNVAPMVHRRIPETNNIPALPTRTTTTRSTGGGAAAPVNIPASGDVASYAVRFVGSRYVWGGSSPASGFDCSGLTSYVYRQFGVSLPHSAAGQFNSRYGAVISSIGSLAPGDLVFFANTGGRRGITHVGIYIGSGQLVHAMTPAYGVQVSSMYSSYWQSHFAGAIRVRR